MLTKINSFIVLMLSVCSIAANAQFVYFDKLYDFGSGNGYADASAGVINDTGGYYFVTRSINLSLNTSQGILCRINYQGDTTITVKIKDDTISYVSTEIARTVDNGIIIGSSVKNATSFTGQRDYALTKINIDGEIEFSGIYGDSINDEQALDIVTTYDKGFLIVGQSVVPPLDSADMYAIKTDSLGNFEWEHYYGGTYFEGCNSAIQTPDSGYLILGWTKSFGNAQEDFYLVKTDNFGNQQWQKNYGGEERDMGISITNLIDNNYLLTGSSGGNGVSNGVIRKIDSLGTGVWNRHYKHEDNPQNNFWKTLELSDGSLVSVGMTHITDDAGWLMKTDSAGNKLWSRMYNENVNIDLFYDFITTNDDGFLLSGMAWNTANSSQDAWLLKVDSMGCPYPNCTVGIDEDDNARVVADIWPNPVSELLNIEFQNMDDWMITLTDVDGKVVYETTDQGLRTTVNVSTLSNGIYVLQLVNDNSLVNKKIIISH